VNRVEYNDKLRRARKFAHDLAKRNHYRYEDWLKGRTGICKAGFERDGQFWSLAFQWSPREGFDALQHSIEKLDFALTIAQREFTALKFGAAMRDAGHSPATVQ
jgi:hypothetical protein